MARGRAATIFSIVILAVACLRSVVGVKVHAEAASLNETIVRHDDDSVEENEVSREFGNKTDELSRDHPHNIHGKPTKFDIEFHANDKADYQIEPTRIVNATANPIEMNSTNGLLLSNSTDCRGMHMVSCIRKDFSNFLDQLSQVDTYNVTESVQIVRNPEADVAYGDQKKNNDTNSNFLDKVHHYARTHVMKIRLNKDLSLARKARTFFGCEFLDRLLWVFVACVLVPLLLSTRKVNFLKLHHTRICIVPGILYQLLLSACCGAILAAMRLRNL